MADIVDQAKEGAKEALKTPTKEPVKALVVALIAVSAVVLLEIFFPGVITGRIRALFTSVGVKKGS